MEYGFRGKCIGGRMVKSLLFGKNPICKHILLQYKWLSRQYITPYNLHQKGSLFHCMWSCPQVARFWREVLNIIGRIIGKVMPTDPKLCILNIYPVHFVVSNDKKNLELVCAFWRQKGALLGHGKKNICLWRF